MAENVVKTVTCDRCKKVTQAPKKTTGLTLVTKFEVPVEKLGQVDLCPKCFSRIEKLTAEIAAVVPIRRKAKE